MASRTAKIPKLATADVCDASGRAVDVIALPWRDYGKRLDFAGPVSTLKTIDDNTHVRTLLEEQGEGRVLIIDGAGSMRSALVGGNLAALASQNGWAGIIVNGCVRDIHELIDEDIGIKALATCPRKSIKNNQGDINIPISIGGVIVKPGFWIIADGDGVVVSPELPSL
ncbi:ribonuclease E activity regulator RraA [Kordiimonas sp. SCSIO 12610]|uniref:ribonuclease E activity regulator RraA n=1 Tax=Kordiimonas sp. SCSIO 12610 TaxID=2829597 RepID=UPI00210C434A|nr:ribonuclease E activity regulator RraA [Kordiimonas sp. SCSIO 12610]UTW55158.1 ribonuclease E activity regulator RraA [Kordiimonas sp. SCSIO 12610]